MEGTIQVGTSWRPVVRRKRLAKMIVDTSVMIAILRDEPDARELASALESADVRRIAAATNIKADYCDRQ
jgi:hypothetical protein